MSDAEDPIAGRLAVSEPDDPLPAEIVREAVSRYSLAADARVTFVRHGENTTYRLEAAGRQFALRINRPGYQTVAAIRSELAWMDSLRESGVPTPPAHAGPDGERIQVLDPNGRTAVLLEWIDGTPLNHVDAVEPWRRLGELMARIHEHSRRWDRPDWFTRPPWDAEALVGDKPRWGPPDPEGLLRPVDREAVEACRMVVRERLAALGTDRDRYGLIHGDLGFENALVCPDGRVAVIDFDDCGESWYLHELAVALYPYDGTDGFDARRDALVSGYRSVSTLPQELLDELPTFLMARRIATLGWVFSRPETRHAHQQRPRRLQTTPDAAQAYLAWAGHRPVASATTSA